MNIAAIVILFNPENIGEDKLLANIKSYSSEVKKIYVVDNSKETHEELASKIPCSEYLYNGNKGGIAGAQNIGWKKAREDGFDFIMTMDQDSAFIEDEAKKYISLVSDYAEKNPDCVCFGPRINDLNMNRYITKQIRFRILSPLKRKVFSIIKKDWKPFVLPEIEINRNLIASSNIVRISALEKVGGYDEELFIDQVDYDLCSKIKNAGFTTVKFNTVFLNQIYGDKNWFTYIRPKSTYSQFRLYYIIRNHIIMAYRYDSLAELYNRELKELFWQYCIFSLKAFSNRKVFSKARKDAAAFIEKEKNSLENN